eukprot:4159558-Alexandrium_andersonii.AAC.1
MPLSWTRPPKWPGVGPWALWHSWPLTAPGLPSHMAKLAGPGPPCGSDAGRSGSWPPAGRCQCSRAPG